MGAIEFFRRLVDRIDSPVVAKEPTLRVRWAEPGDDLGDAWRILASCGGGIYAGDEPGALTDCLYWSASAAKLDPPMPLFLLAVATWGEHAIGVACGVVGAEGVSVTWVAVCPSRRRLGVGRQLLRMFEAKAEAADASLFTVVPESILEACCFFRQCGWSASQSRPIVDLGRGPTIPMIRFRDREQAVRIAR